MTPQLQELLLPRDLAPDAGETQTRTQPLAEECWLPLLERLATLGWLQAGERLTRAEPAGVGNMNRTLRIELATTTARRSLVLKQALPYVARYPDIPAPIERGAVEAAFYRAVAPVTEIADAMPRLLGYDAEYQLLALEDLGTARDFSALYEDLPEERRAVWRSALPAIMDWLLALHTLAPVADAQDNQAMRALNHEHIFEVPYTESAAVALPAALEDLREQLCRDARARSRIDDLGRLYLGSGTTLSLTNEPVRLHGDYYPGSWLLDVSDRPHVIDPEFSFVGPAEFDLGVMRAHLALAGEPDATWRSLLERYQSRRKIDGALLQDFAAAEVLRRVFGVAQLPLSLNDEEILTQCTYAWQTLSR